MRPLLISSIALASLTLVGCHRNNNYWDSSYEVVNETYVHKYGVEVPAEEWSDRGEHGQVISNLKNGVVVKKTYDWGKLNGETSYSFPHSDITERVEVYTNDQLVKEITFYMSGARKSEKEYYGPNSWKITTWYENAIPKTIESYNNSNLANGEYYNPKNQMEGRVDQGSGTRVVRDEYGVLDHYENYENGRMVSQMTVHADGLPKDVTPYNNGIVDGEKKTYYPGGEPQAIEQWSSGNQHGTTTTFKNGEKYSEVPYNYGLKNGVEKRYKDGQTVTEEVSWLNDQRHGPSVAYIGNTVQTTWYFQGQEVTKNRYDFLNSRPMQ